MSGLIYVGLFVFSAVFTIGAFIFGHDGASDHDFGGAGHDTAGDTGTPSIFSARVVSLFLLGFSGMGLISTYVWHLGAGLSALAGVGFGLVMGGVGYALVALFYRQQFNSMVAPTDYVGMVARVSGAIQAGGTGEVSVTVKEQLRTILAVSADGSAIPEGRNVKIIRVTGGTATVEPV